MVVFFRFLIIIAFIILAYSTVKYLINPKRKLELAHQQKSFYFFDSKENVRKNFLVTYRGVMFEGEKYLGTTDEAFDVVSIQIWAKNDHNLTGLNKADFAFIQKEVQSSYPNADITWKSPIKELLKKS